MAVGNPSKNAPSSGNCSIPDPLVMNDTAVNHSESVPLGQMRNLVGMTSDCSVGNLDNWTVPTGKGYIWVGCPDKVLAAVAVAEAVVADKSAATEARAVHPVSPADNQC